MDVSCPQNPSSHHFSVTCQLPVHLPINPTVIQNKQMAWWFFWIFGCHFITTFLLKNKITIHTASNVPSPKCQEWSISEHPPPCLFCDMKVTYATDKNPQSLSWKSSMAPPHRSYCCQHYLPGVCPSIFALLLFQKTHNSWHLNTPLGLLIGL